MYKLVYGVGSSVGYIVPCRWSGSFGLIRDRVSGEGGHGTYAKFLESDPSSLGSILVCKWSSNRGIFSIEFALHAPYLCILFHINYVI
jgi:hypothetical protein